MTHQTLVLILALVVAIFSFVGGGAFGVGLERARTEERREAVRRRCKALVVRAFQVGREQGVLTAMESMRRAAGEQDDVELPIPLRSPLSLGDPLLDVLNDVDDLDKPKDPAR